MFVCSCFLISVYMFIVSKALLISSATVIVRARGAIWLNPFAMELFSVCSAVTVECFVLYPCCVGVFGMFGVMKGRWIFSSVFAISERSDMGLYEVPLSMSLLSFGMGTMLSNFHMCGIMLVLRAVFNMLVNNASLRWPMCFRCLMFSLLGPCELLFLLCLIAPWTWVVVSVMLYPCMLCVALWMDLFVLCVACLTVFFNCLVKQVAICLGVVASLLLNVMEVFSVGGVALLVIPCMVFQRMCVLCLWSQCASMCSFHRFCLCFCMSV